MKIYIIRHAEKESGSYYNPRLRHQDEPISEKGRRSAERLSAFFAERPIDAIFVSGYRRTGETIQPVARQLGLTPIVDERLNEIDNGLIEALSDTEIQEQYPDVWRAFMERSADFRFPEGETGEEVRSRIASFLDEKRNQYPNGIIAVTHDGLIRTLMCHVLGLPVYRRWDFQIDFCGIVELSIRPDSGGWKLIRFNHACL